MYELKYPAPGAPALAKRVKELLEKGGIGPVKEGPTRGLDHGAWVPLSLVYQEAGIPVCQLSVQSTRGACQHYDMVRALGPSRDEGVLILGSGNATHNLSIRFPDGTPDEQWALDFDTWLKDALLDGRHDNVNNYLEKAPYAKKAHPSPDHLLPQHVALGAAGMDAKTELIHHSFTNATISHASYRFTNNALE